MRVNRLPSTPRIAPTPVSRKTGATESWIGVVDAYRTRKSENERIDSCGTMIQAVGKSLRSGAVPAR